MIQPLFSAKSQNTIVICQARSKMYWRKIVPMDLRKILRLHLTLEQHQFELCGFAYTLISFAIHNLKKLTNHIV